MTLESIEGSSKAISSSQSKGQTHQGKQSREHLLVHSLQASPKRDGKKGAKTYSFCQNNHYITFCDKFKSKALPERKDFVKKESLCQNCLGKHSFQSCRSDRRCFICKGKHHTSLLNSVIQRDTAPLETKSLLKAAQHSNAIQVLPPTAHLKKIVELPLSQVLLATDRVYVKGPNGVGVLARALIDQVSLISRSLCQRLRLKNKAVHVSICGVGSCTAAVSSKSISFTIRPLFKSNFSSQVQILGFTFYLIYTPPTLHMSCELIYLNSLNWPIQIL